MKNQYGIEPCPFCGTSVVSCEYDGHYIWVECGNSNCKASMMAVRMDNGDADEAKKMWNTRPIEDALRAELAKARAEIAELTATCTECKEPVWCTTKAEVARLKEQLAEAQAENASLRSMMKSEAFEGLSTKQLIFIIHSMQDERGAKCLEYEAVIEKLNEQLSLAGQALTGLGYTPSADDSGSYDSLIPDKYP